MRELVYLEQKLKEGENEVSEPVVELEPLKANVFDAISTG